MGIISTKLQNKLSTKTIAMAFFYYYLDDFEKYYKNLTIRSQATNSTLTSSFNKFNI